MHFQQSTFRIPQLKERFEELLSHLWGLGAAVKVDLENLDVTVHAHPDAMANARKAIDDIVNGRDLQAAVAGTEAVVELVKDEKSTSGTDTAATASVPTAAHEEEKPAVVTGY